MAGERTITWEGVSGKTYKYWIYEMGMTFKSAAGNYIFAKETRPGYFKTIYIGQTEDLSERLDNHHAMPCIKRAGSTHIHAHKNNDKAARLAEERDLIAKWNPTCNE